MSYDTKCWELAKFFLEDHGVHEREDAQVLLGTLAQNIQNTIEQFIDEKFPGQ